MICRVCVEPKKTLGCRAGPNATFRAARTRVESPNPTRWSRYRPDRYSGGVVRVFRVFILDDHELVRIGLRRLIEAQDDLVLVGEASSGTEALAALPAARPDVAVLDVRLPDIAGVEICREVRSRHPEVQCLMLTAVADESTLFAAIIAGAAGYVLKQSAGTTLIDAIRSVAKGESQLDASVTRPILERIRSGNQGDDLLHRMRKNIQAHTLFLK